MTVSAFEHVTLFVPSLWDKPWATAIKDADGLEQSFLRGQSAYASLLRRVSATPTTPEKIAYLSLWSRLYGSLTGARGATECQSRFAVNIIGRVAFEASLHLQAVMLPVLESCEAKGNPLTAQHWQDVRDRLCGYLAWMLRADQLRYIDLSSRRVLDEAFDPHPEREFIRDLGEAREVWQRLSQQPLEVVSDEEASFDRERARKRLRAKASRIERWLADGRLAHWRDKLHQLERTGDRKGATTLFQLFDMPQGVMSFLRRRGAAIGYSSYARGSGFVHGSSLEASLMVTDNFVSPDFADLSEELEEAANGVISGCGIARILLDLLTSHLSSDAPAV